MIGGGDHLGGRKSHPAERGIDTTSYFLCGKEEGGKGWFLFLQKGRKGNGYVLLLPPLFYTPRKGKRRREEENKIIFREKAAPRNRAVHACPSDHVKKKKKKKRKCPYHHPQWVDERERKRENQGSHPDDRLFRSLARRR